MGVSYTQELINEIADAVQIDNMRTEKKKSAMNIGPIGKLNVYRKGVLHDGYHVSAQLLLCLVELSGILKACENALLSASNKEYHANLM